MDPPESFLQAFQSKKTGDKRHHFVSCLPLSSFKGSGLFTVVSDHAVHTIALKLLSSIKTFELDHDQDAGHNSAQLFNQLRACLDRSAGRQQIIYKKDPLSGFDGINMDFKGCFAVFQVIVDRLCLPGKFSLFTNRRLRQNQDP